MITKSGGVKLVDFGLVNLSGRSVLTQEGTTLGTMAYMVPGTDTRCRMGSQNGYLGVGCSPV